MIRILLLIILVIVVGGGGFLYFWDIPVEQTPVEQKVDARVLRSE